MNQQKDDDMEPSNADLMARLNELEVRVDHLCDLVEQANGAWMLIKVMGSIMLGLIGVWSALHNWWQK